MLAARAQSLPGWVRSLAQEGGSGGDHCTLVEGEESQPLVDLCCKQRGLDQPASGQVELLSSCGYKGVFSDFIPTTLLCL